MNSNRPVDEALIRRLGEEFFEAVNTANLDRRMATMCAETIIMAPDRPPLADLEQIRRVSADYQANFEESCAITYDEIEAAEDFGFVRATVDCTRRSKADGKVTKFTLKNLWIVKRCEDGAWRFWRIMFNSNAPIIRD